ncbi:MAG: hypothetical protein ACE5HX_00775 [bacterium]
MRYYHDENGNQIAQNLIEIQYLCRQCQQTFWDEVMNFNKITCPNESCRNVSHKSIIAPLQPDMSASVTDSEMSKRKSSIKLFTIKEENGAVKLPYRFRYPHDKKGFILLSFNMSLQ